MIASLPMSLVSLEEAVNNPVTGGADAKNHNEVDASTAVPGDGGAGFCKRQCRQRKRRWGNQRGDVMVDRLWSLSQVWRSCMTPSACGMQDFGFYLPLVMSARSVLDVGCGTGELLRLTRKAGHTGRLCGLDPANAMLDEAREAVRHRVGAR